MKESISLLKNRCLSFAKASMQRIGDPICIIAFAQLFIQCIHCSFFPYFIIFLQKSNYGIDTISSLVLLREIMKVSGVFLGGVCSDFRWFKLLTVAAFALSSLGYFTLAFSSSLTGIFLGYCIAGFFYGFAYPGESNLIVHFQNQWSFRRIYSLIKTCMMIGTFIAPFIGFVLVFHNPKTVAIAYGSFFILYPSVIAILLPKIKKEAVSTRKASIGYSPILKNIPFMQLVFCLLILTICSSMMFTSLPLYLQKNFSNGLSIYSTILSLNALITIIMQIFVTKFLEKFQNKDMIHYGILLFCVIFMLLSVFNSSSIAIVVLFSFFTFIELIIMPNAYSLIIQLADKENIGKYQAFGNLRYFLAAPISALFGKCFVEYKSLYFFSYFLFTLLVIPVFSLIRRSNTHVD